MFSLVHQPFAGVATKFLPGHDFSIIVAGDLSVVDANQVVGGLQVNTDVQTFCSSVPAAHLLVQTNRKKK